MSTGAVAEVLDVPGLLDYIDEVEAALVEAVGWAEGEVATAGSETLRSGGKRLRPMLVYLSAPVGGRGRPALVSAGCAVELVHMATLVHDDQLDAARLRRGRPTVWASRGETVALRDRRLPVRPRLRRALHDRRHGGGDDPLRGLPGAGPGRDPPARAVRQPGHHAGAVSRPLPAQDRPPVLGRRRLGGGLGGLAAADVERLGDFAVALGLAFQIADDILDCDGRPDTTGKPLGTDLLDGTVTLPLILGASRDPAVAGVIARGAAPEDVLPTLARVSRAGGVRDARVVAERHADQALGYLDAIDGGVDSAALRAVVRGAVDRDA